MRELVWTKMDENAGRIVIADPPIIPPQIAALRSVSPVIKSIMAFGRKAKAMASAQKLLNDTELGAFNAIPRVMLRNPANGDAALVRHEFVGSYLERGWVKAMPDVVGSDAGAGEG